MSKKIVNLTLSVVEQELDSLLEMYPHKLHQLELTPDLRKELLVYVLNRIPNVYKTSDDLNLDNPNVKTFSCTLEQKMQIRALFFQGVNYLALAKYSDRVYA